ncbi:nuclear transport factor 2 family protein [Ferrimonas pelagia]|uniref:Nuclear transport factor 2 family protein n=1 Tax=Ferrimonas pelagia TaxID=1177826 RepID=A0ABP9EMZ2_9GAMM
MALATQEIARLMEQYIRLVDQQDIDGIVAMYAVDAVVEDPVGKMKIEGIDAIDAFYRNGLGRIEASAKQEGPVRSTEIGEGLVAFEVMLNGEEGPMVIETIDWMKFSDEGKILAMKAYWSEDNFRFMHDIKRQRGEVE